MLARQSYRLSRRFATILLAISTVSGIAHAADEPRLYVFSMPGCRPCQQMEPDVDRLIQAGYPVTKVDCVANEAWANYFQITQTPTTVLVVDQRIVSRSLGPKNFGELVQLFDAVGFRPQSAAATAAPRTNTAIITHAAANTSLAPPERAPSVAPAVKTSWTQPKQLAHQATIRIKVDDPQGTSYATGTVIHRHDNEYLAITCGHVFRESHGSGTITVEFGFADGQPMATQGQLIKYDSNARDVGLIAFHSQRPIEPVHVGPENLPITPGDQAFTFGCDHGEPPTLRETQILRTSIYDGARKYDIAGRPVDGRSGGGLFSAGGQLIGICNAAAVDVDEGVYTSLENIYWQLTQAQLTRLFQGSANVATSSPAPSQPTGRLDVRAADDGRHVEGEVEIIMVVRSKSNPELAETYSVQQPSAQLLGLVQAMRDSESSSNRTAANRESLSGSEFATQAGGAIPRQSR